MASPLAQRNNFKYTPRPALPEALPLVLPATWLLVIGALNLFYGISVIAGSHLFITTASWLVGDARPWGWLMVIVGLVQMGAAPAVLMRRWWAIWIGLLSVAWHMVAASMFSQDYLGFAIAFLLLDAVRLAGLCPAASRPRQTAAGHWCGWRHTKRSLGGGRESRDVATAPSSGPSSCSRRWCCSSR